MSNMKKVTKNNLLTLVNWKKEYINKKEKGIEDKLLLSNINDYVENVVNKDKSYYKKLLECRFDNETLEFLIY